MTKYSTVVAPAPGYGLEVNVATKAATCVPISTFRRHPTQILSNITYMHYGRVWKKIP